MGEVFSDSARLQSMLDFEAALARAEARAGVIPDSAALVIVSKCRVELIDINALSIATAASLNPAIPLIKQLITLVAKDDSEAARFVHWGATSQDANDTGVVLQIRRAFDILEKDLASLCAGLAQLAKTPEFELHHAGAALERDFHRPVGAARIDDDDFRRPRHALQGRADLQLLVAREDED